VIGQFFAVEMRVRVVPGWEGWLFYGFVFGVRERMNERMVPGIFPVLLPVLARPTFDWGFRHVSGLWVRMSW
jgi:hypothetical protein